MVVAEAELAAARLASSTLRRKHLLLQYLTSAYGYRTDLENIFGEVCPRITQLVQEQIDAVKASSGITAKAIFLVGGFGANKYLKEELQKSFRGIEIQQPKDA